MGKNAKSKKASKFESLKAAINEEENEESTTGSTEVAADKAKPVKKRKGLQYLV